MGTCRLNVVIHLKPPYYKREKHVAISQLNGGICLAPLNYIRDKLATTRQLQVKCGYKLSKLHRSSGSSSHA
jgi:hypothetical protein